MKTGKKFDIEDYLKLDADLSSITFNEISVTGVVGHFLKNSYSVANYQPGNIKENLLWLYQYLRLSNSFLYQYKNKQINKKKDLNNKYWFMLTATHPRLLDQLLPVIDQLGHDRCIIISPQNQFKESLKDVFCAVPTLSKKEFRQWESQFSKNKVLIKEKLSSIRQKYKLSSLAARLLYINIIYQTQLIFLFKNLLGQFSPKGIVVDASRQTINGAMVSCGQKMKIPTYELIHGSVSPPDNYIPFLADKIFCWGKLQYDELSLVNNWNTELIISGNPRIKRTYRNIDQAKLNTIFPSNKDVVALITNNIRLEWRLRFAEEFAKATASLSNVVAYIRIHPSERIDEYQPIQEKYPHVVILENDVLSLDETLYVAKIVVMHNSALGIEAIAKKKIVVILDNIEYPLGLGEMLVQEAGCRRVKTHDELNAFIQHVINDSSFTELLLTQQEAFIHSYCDRYDMDAAQFISNYLQKIHTPLASSI